MVLLFSLLSDNEIETGFKPTCPHEIQTVLIDRLAVWGDKNNIFTIMWDSNSNAPIMLEMNRQTCLLPLTYTASVKKSIQIFRSWLMVTMYVVFILHSCRTFKRIRYLMISFKSIGNNL